MPDNSKKNHQNIISIMILIFDSGSTKTTVAKVSDSDTLAEFIPLSRGINAMTVKNGELKGLISECDALLSDAEHVGEVYYYGAGCATDEACERIRTDLSLLFRNSRIEVSSDMLGAARVCSAVIQQGLLAFSAQVLTPACMTAGI